MGGVTWILAVILAVLVAGLLVSLAQYRRDWTHRGLPPDSR